MAELAQLRALAERLEKAARPDRELDEAVLLATGWKNKGPAGRNIDCPYDDVGEVWFSPVGPRYWWSKAELPRPSHSIDAALALVERLLPDNQRGVYLNIYNQFGDAACKIGDRFNPEFEAPTAPLAILNALVDALIAVAEADHA